MGTRLYPLADRILVRRDVSDERTASGIYIPEQAKEKPFIGSVLAVGYDAKDYIKVGDKVLFSRYGGVDVQSGGEDMIVMRVADVMALVKEDSDE